MNRITIAFFALFTCLLLSNAQVSLHYNSNTDNIVDRVRGKERDTPVKIMKMPSSALTEMVYEDSLFADADMPYRFGYAFDVDYSLSDGKWYQDEKGRTWSLSFESEGALSMNFVFESFHLPEGAELFVYNKEKTALYGPVKADAIPDNGFFLTALLPGEEATIELYEPNEVKGLSTLNIKRVVHGYRGIQPRSLNLMTNDSGFDADVACYPDYEKESRGVGVVLLAGGDALCSGALLMTTDSSFKPYFLTAFHCIDEIATGEGDGYLSELEVSIASRYMYMFLYRNEECDGQPMTSYTYQGGTLRAAWQPTDAVLMEIAQDVSANPFIYWLGWDRRSNNPSCGVCLHHPWGNLMEIAFEDDEFDVYEMQGSSHHNFWKVNFDDGMTQHISSGSPILDENNRVVGQLMGGPANTTNAKFGRFGRSWDGGGTSSTSFSFWLDSIGTNQQNTNTSRKWHPGINGSRYLCRYSTVVYRLDSIPPGSIVNWSFTNHSNGSNPDITYNSPTNRECTVYHCFSDAFYGELKATVIYDGQQLGVYSATISGEGPFVGFYREIDGTGIDPIYENSVSLEEPNYATPSNTVIVRSDNFVGNSVYIKTDVAPNDAFNDWGLQLNVSPDGSIAFEMPDLVAGHYARIAVSNEYNNSITILKFYAPPTYYSLNIMPIGNNLYRLSIQGGSEGRRETGADYGSNTLQTNGWGFDVYDANTQQRKATMKVNGDSYTLDTSGWRQGIYVVRATIGGFTVSEKIIVD